jgi:hypothetical protein
MVQHEALAIRSNWAALELVEFNEPVLSRVNAVTVDLSATALYSPVWTKRRSFQV